jgi:hypothetical protein
METKSYDLDQWEKGELADLTRQGFKPSYQGGALTETKKAKITTQFETRPHKFADGETGEVAQKLTVTIDFSDLVVQPDQDFEDHFCRLCADHISGHIEGAWDNSEE